MSLTCTEGYNLLRKALPNSVVLNSWSAHDLICCAEQLNAALAEGQSYFIVATRKYPDDPFISGIDLILRQNELHQFSWTCEQQVTFRNLQTRGVQFYIPDEHLTYGQAIALAQSWDASALLINHPDNNGRHVIVDWADPYTKSAWQACLAHARQTGSMASFSRCVSYLANTKNRQSRVRLYPYAAGDEMSFEIQQVNQQGEWKRVIHGGLIYHRSSNEWSTHT